MMERTLTITAKEAASVSQLLLSQAGLSRKQISQAKFRPGGIQKNGRQCRVTETVHPGDRITVCLEDASSCSGHLAPPPEALPPIQALYEDQDLLAVNKPAGIVTHPSGSHYSDSLSNQVFWYFASRGENVRIRSVGRLDKETSGIVIFAKNQPAAARLQAQRSTKTFRKEYLAVVSGYLPEDGWHTISFPIGPDPTDPLHIKMSAHMGLAWDSSLSESFPAGKAAITHYQVLYSTSGWSLVNLRLETGRTHQIRVHMKAIGHPLLGDTLYGAPGPVPAPFSFSRAALHAWRVTLLNPFTNRKIHLQTELPEDFKWLSYTL